ncbi:MAG: PEP-CTERM sorting domain-containing protein [Pseudomonadota bacterium]
MKFITSIAVAITATILLIVQAHAATFFANGTVAQANAQRAQWEADARVDGDIVFDGLGTISGDGPLTTNLGNTFTVMQGSLVTRDFAFPVGVTGGKVLDAGAAALNPGDTPKSVFTWTFAESTGVAALAFNAFDADDGNMIITMKYASPNFPGGFGTFISSVRFSGTQKNLFFGVSNFSTLGITSVEIATTDSSGITIFDNFSYVAVATPVPVPASALLLVGGLGLMGWVGRRRRVAR